MSDGTAPGSGTGGPRQRWDEGTAARRESRPRAGAASRLTPPYLLGHVFKFISCQFPLESQSENVHAALIMTTAETAPYLESATGAAALLPAPWSGPHYRHFTDKESWGLER